MKLYRRLRWWLRLRGKSLGFAWAILRQPVKVENAPVAMFNGRQAKLTGITFLDQQIRLKFAPVAVHEFMAVDRAALAVSGELRIRKFHRPTVARAGDSLDFTWTLEIMSWAKD